MYFTKIVAFTVTPPMRMSAMTQRSHFSLTSVSMPGGRKLGGMLLTKLGTWIVDRSGPSQTLHLTRRALALSY